MNDFEIISYTETPNSERMAGYVTCCLNKTIILKYKIVNAKNGGIYIQSPSFLAPDASGNESWHTAVSFDSKTVEQVVQKKIRDYVQGNDVSVTAPENIDSQIQSGRKLVCQTMNDEMPF